jgi:hypothetical protein
VVKSESLGISEDVHQIRQGEEREIVSIGFLSRHQVLSIRFGQLQKVN